MTLAVNWGLEPSFKEYSMEYGSPCAVRPLRDDETAVRHPAVVAAQLLKGDKMDGGVVLGKIVGHGDNLTLDLGQIRALLRDDPAFAQMLIARSQLRILARAHGGDRRFDRHGVLLGIHDTRDAADGVGVALTDAAAPKRVIAAVREDGVCHHAV